MEAIQHKQCDAEWIVADISYNFVFENVYNQETAVLCLYRLDVTLKSQ